MNTYWWRLSRPAWIAGAAAVAGAVYLGALALGWADDVNGTCWTFGRISIVVASAAAAPLRDLAAPVLDATPFGRRRRRLTPPVVALGVLAAVWTTLAVLQATRVPDVPWAGLMVETAAMSVLACAVGALWGRRVDAGLIGPAALVLVVLVDETTGIGPWLTAWPGPRWETGRAAWAVLAGVAAVVLLTALRDPARAPVRGRP